MPTIIRPPMSQLHQMAFEAYGVPIAIGVANPELFPRIREILPPGWREHDPADVVQHFSITTREAGVYRLFWDGGSVAGSSDLDIALDVLETKIRTYVAQTAPGLIFVHAGAVVHNGRAVLIPGMTFSGKTTLTAELVRAGATYYSDEYAVLDEDGRVHPYAKPLSMRAGGRQQTEHPVEAFGGTAGEGLAEVGLVVITQYRPGAEWQPQRLSAGAGALALMGNAVPAQERPAETLAAIRKAVESAVVLEGERGEASLLAQQLLTAAAA